MAKKWRKPQPKVAIEPSTKLITVNTHKIWDWCSCKRLYFWRWIRNLVPKPLNHAFYYGSLLHLGKECLTGELSNKETRVLINKEADKIIRAHPLTKTPVEDLYMTRDMVYNIVKAYKKVRGSYKPPGETIAVETSFAFKMRRTPVIMIGTVDEYGKNKNKLYLDETKSSSKIDAEYFGRLKFDKQINIYAIGVKCMEGKLPNKCYYNVFRKPCIRQKKGESRSEYVQRFYEDMLDRPDFYFIQEIIRFGSYVYAVMDDVEAHVQDMYRKYKFHKTADLLKPENWGKEENQCLAYGVCPYYTLCKNLKNWKIYTRIYQMREIRYTPEWDELLTTQIAKKYIKDKKFKPRKVEEIQDEW